MEKKYYKGVEVTILPTKSARNATTNGSICGGLSTKGLSAGYSRENYGKDKGYKIQDRFIKKRKKPKKLRGRPPTQQQLDFAKELGVEIKEGYSSHQVEIYLQKVKKTKLARLRAQNRKSVTRKKSNK